MADFRPGEPYKLNATQTRAVKEAVAKDLKDPESACFEEPFVSAKDGTKIHVCGRVNAKNSYGGYTGSKPFQVMGFESKTVFVPISIGGTDIETTVTLEACSRLGTPL